MRLEDYMAITGRKVRDLASELGVTPNAVRRWVDRTRTPSPDQMRAIFLATKGAVRPDDFVLGVTP